MIRLSIDADELNALIDFQSFMQDEARHNCEHMEALERRARIAQLEAIASRHKAAAATDGYVLSRK